MLDMTPAVFSKPRVSQGLEPSYADRGLPASEPLHRCPLGPQGPELEVLGQAELGVTPVWAVPIITCHHALARP